MMSGPQAGICDAATYGFEVSVSIALAVHVRNRGYYLTEDSTALLL